MTWHQVPFRKVHSIEEIGEQCIGIDSSLGSLVDKAVPLTEYAWKYRYPGNPDEPSVQEAKVVLSIAKEVLAAVLERMPSDVRE